MTTDCIGRTLQPRMVYSNEVVNGDLACRGMPVSSDQDLGLESKPSRILVVDDNSAVLSLTAELLEHMGYLISMAEDGIGALSRLKTDSYDILLTDYEMPGLDGYELAVAAKQQCFGIKVIIMTGHCTDELAERIGASATIDGFLPKPFDLRALNDTLNQVRRKRFPKLMA